MWDNTLETSSYSETSDHKEERVDRQKNDKSKDSRRAMRSSGGESGRPAKRSLRAISAAEKMLAIQRVHAGKSKASVARDLGVPESTLRGWCKSEHKIRGMARNSSTPDSEVHSPVSSCAPSTAVVAATVTVPSSLPVSSEDEGYVPKKPKLDPELDSKSRSPPCKTAPDSSTENESGAEAKAKTATTDYMALMSNMAAMRPDGGSLLLQQLGLLPGASSAMGKNVLNIPSGLPQQSSVVGLVENGLQYTKSSNRHSTSAVTPTQMDSVSKSGSRNSLPAAAEAPSTPAPASPRKTNENIQNLSKGKKENGPANKVEEGLWLWLTKQQQLLGQQSAMFTPSANQDGGSWFWKWYKQYGFAPVAATPMVTKKSPSKARALLDNVLCNNNNENVKRSLNLDQAGTEAGDVPPTTEEAVAHGEKFLKWLEKCSEPSVSRMQIMQFRYLLDNLKTCRKPTSSLKRSRK